MAGLRAIDCGDFAVGTFQAKVQRESRHVGLLMDRVGRAGDWSIRVKKTIGLTAGEAMLTVGYQIEQIPSAACLHFAVEINLALMAGDGHDGSYYSSTSGTKLGRRDSTLDLPHTRGLSLADRSQDLSVSLDWSQSAGLWCFPIESIRETNGLHERVYQSSAVIPHWHVTPDERGRWEVSIGLAFERVTTSTAAHRTRELLTPTTAS